MHDGHFMHEIIIIRSEFPSSRKECDHTESAVL